MTVIEHFVLLISLLQWKTSGAEVGGSRPSFLTLVPPPQAWHQQANTDISCAQGHFRCSDGSLDVYYTPYLPATHGAAWDASLATTSAQTSSVPEASASLSHVRMEEASLGGLGAAHLAHQLRELHSLPAPPLEHLSLCRNAIPAAGGACLLRASLRPPATEKTSKASSMNNLKDSLPRACKQPLTLHLDLNPLGDDSLRGLPGCVASSGARGTLQELSLRRCCLGVGAARSLASALCAQHCSSSSESSHGGADTGASSTVSSSGTTDSRGNTNGICGPPQLQRLYLGDNPSMGDEGCVALAAALSRPGACPNLEVLSLANCGVGDAGAKALASALRYHPTLKQLDLGRNRIGELGAAELAEALISPGCGLTTLDLRQNPKLGDAGATAFGACLGSGLGQHLTSLHLGWCGIGPKGCKAVVDGIRRAHTFRATTTAAAVAGASPVKATRSSASNTAPVPGAAAAPPPSSSALVEEGVVQPLVAPSVSPGLGLQHLDLSGNWIEGNKPKSDDKYKEQVGSALLKVSGVLAKARGRVGGDGNAMVGGVFSAADQFLSRGHQTFAPKKRGTGAGGSGALARLLRSRSSSVSSGGSSSTSGRGTATSSTSGSKKKIGEDVVSSPSSSSSGGASGPPSPTSGFLLRLAGCGLEARHMKLLEKAAAAVNAAQTFATGGEKDNSEEGAAYSAAVVLDLRLNVVDDDKSEKSKKAKADTSSSDDESREAWVDLEGSEDETSSSGEAAGADDDEILSDDDEDVNEDEVIIDGAESDYQSDNDGFSDEDDHSGDYDDNDESDNDEE